MAVTVKVISSPSVIEEAEAEIVTVGVTVTVVSSPSSTEYDDGSKLTVGVTAMRFSSMLVEAIAVSFSSRYAQTTDPGDWQPYTVYGMEYEVPLVFSSFL